MALQEIQYGSLASSELVNDNFEYLDNRITTVGSSITTLQSNLASVNSTINGRIDGVIGDIDDLSNDVYKAINQLAASGTIALDNDSINAITPEGAVTFTLPSVSDNTIFHQILVQVNLTTVYSINVGTTHFFNSKSPDLSTIGKYNLIFEYDKASDAWICGWMRKS